MPISVKVSVDQRELDRAVKRLERYAGRPLHERARRAYLETARLGVRPIRAASPRVSGSLRASVRARSLTGPRLRPGEMAAASVGPRKPHRHLVTQGHRIVTRGGRDTGRRSRADPFVDRAFEQYGERARAFAESRTLDLGIRTYTSL